MQQLKESLTTWRDVKQLTDHKLAQVCQIARSLPNFPFLSFAAIFFSKYYLHDSGYTHLRDNNSKKINTMHQEFKIRANYRKEIIRRIKPLIPMSSPLTSDRPKSEGHTCCNIFIDLIV